MNVQIEWEGGVPEPLASIYRAMSGDRESFLDAARQLCGSELVDVIKAESNKKVRRVDDMLDGNDPLERIEERLDAMQARSQRRGTSPVTPDEMSSRDAAAFLGVSTDTLDKLFRNGQLARRNASPEGSGKPRYRYRIADLERMKREGFHQLAKPPVAARPKRLKGPSSKIKSRHLDLD